MRVHAAIRLRPPPFLTMRDVSLNSIRPFATGLTWLNDPVIAPTLVTLTAGAMRVVIAPEVGGALAAYCESTSEGPLHWLRPATQAAFDERDPLRMASFPLFPYCNRIRDACFPFDGGTVDLSGNDVRFAHALHGNAWRHPWQGGARTESSVELHFDHEPDNNFANWSREATIAWPDEHRH